MSSKTIRDEAGDERRQAIAERMARAPKPQTGPRRYGCPRPFQAKPRPEGYVTGRPSKYDPAYCQVAIDVMAKGHSVTGLAGHLRVDKDTIYEWMTRHSEFSAAIKIAKACRVEMLEEKLLTTNMGVGVTAAIFALKNADPDEYKDLFQQEHRIDVRIEKVSDSRLLEIVAAAPKQIASPIAPKPDESE